MTVFRGLIVLCLLGLLVASSRASEPGPTGTSSAGQRSARAQAVDERIITPQRARKALEALTAIVVLLYMVQRTRRPWDERRRLGVRGRTRTLSSFRW